MLASGARSHGRHPAPNRAGRAGRGCRSAVACRGPEPPGDGPRGRPRRRLPVRGVRPRGAAGYPEETWLQAGLAAVALAATAAWAGQRGIAARASLPAVYGVALRRLRRVVRALGAVERDARPVVDRAQPRARLRPGRGLGIAAGDERAAGARAHRAGVARRQRRRRALRPRRARSLPGLHVGGLFDLNHTAHSSRLHAPFGDPNALGLACALGVPVALWLAADALRGTPARLAGLAAALLEVRCSR